MGLNFNEINQNFVNYELILNFVSDFSVHQQPVQSTTTDNVDLIINLIREFTGNGYKYIEFQ